MWFKQIQIRPVSNHLFIITSHFFPVYLCAAEQSIHLVRVSQGIREEDWQGLTYFFIEGKLSWVCKRQSCDRIISCKFADLEGCARDETMEGKFPFGQGFMMPSNFSFAVAAFNPMPLQDRSMSVAQPVDMDPLMPSLLVSRSTRWSHEEVCI